MIYNFLILMFSYIILNKIVFNIAIIAIVVLKILKILKIFIKLNCYSNNPLKLFLVLLILNIFVLTIKIIIFLYLIINIIAFIHTIYVKLLNRTLTYSFLTINIRYYWYDAIVDTIKCIIGYAYMRVYRIINLKNSNTKLLIYLRNRFTSIYMKYCRLCCWNYIYRLNTKTL